MKHSGKGPCIFETAAVVSYTVFESAIKLDTFLFFLINSDLQNSFFDAVMPFITTKGHMLAIPFFILIFLREKKLALAILIVAVISFLLSDAAGNIIKHLIARTRPCNALEGVHLLAGCGKAFSMPSNHSGNAFAFALPFLLLTRNPSRYAFILIAALIAFSRIYVGVHYPSDVLAGCILGSITASAVTALYLLAGMHFRKRNPA